MATKEFIEGILKHVENHKSNLEYNDKIYDITEGDLLTHLTAVLDKQLSGDAAKIAVQRAAPINILNKIISKLSKLYAVEPTRTTENSSDLELVKFYEDKGVNQHWQTANEGFNSYKWTTLEIFEDNEDKEIDFRTIPSHQFLAYSDSNVNPLRPSAIIKFMGKYKTSYGEETEKIWVFTKDEFISMTSKGEIIPEDMAENEGVNPYDIIPFTYINKSKTLLVPKIDTDTFTMSILIPLLLTDLNFASMFLSMPQIWGIDIDAENLAMGPNKFWNFKSEDTDGAKPEIGVLKAEPNIPAQLLHVTSQLSMWLETRDIKPGTVGKVNAENFTSGISKIISEMDTLENRMAQQKYFRKAEKDFWRRLAIMHNDLAEAGRIDTRETFSDPENLIVNIEYQEEKIIESRADKVARYKIENEAGFISKKSAITKLNPGMSEEEIVEELKAIAEEGTPDIEIVEE